MFFGAKRPAPLAMKISKSPRPEINISSCWYYARWSTLLPTLLCFLTLPACKKDEPRTVHIKGRVIEYGTGKPIADARIYMLCDNSVVFGPSGSSLPDSCTNRLFIAKKGHTPPRRINKPVRS